MKRAITSACAALLLGGHAAALHAQALPAHAAASRIEAVVLDQGYGMGYNGMITLEYQPMVLFKDGRYTSHADSAVMAQPRIDGRWQRDAAGYALIGNNGKVLHVPAKLRARPAAPGGTLEGAYRSLSGVGQAGTGVAVVAAWKNLQFGRDGSVRLAQGAGASTGDTVTHGSRAGMARYQLDGYAIALAHADGRVETRLFYFFPDSDNAIGLGDDTLSKRR
jgi:hypothetical protein